MVIGEEKRACEASLTEAAGVRRTNGE